MKKVKLFLSIILVFSIFALNGCYQTYNNCKQEVVYSEGVYYDKQWETPKVGESNYSAADKETAISIACAEFKKVQQSGVCKDYVLRGVFLIQKTKCGLFTSAVNPLGREVVTV